MSWKSLGCNHKFDACNLHRFSDDVVAGMCWKCNTVYTASCGLNLPGKLQCAPSIPCQTCNGMGKVHPPPPDPGSVRCPQCRRPAAQHAHRKAVYWCTTCSLEFRWAPL